MARIDLMCIVVMVLSMGSSAQARQLKAGNFFLPTLAPAASAGSSSGGDTTISIAGAGAGPAFKANAQPPRAAPKTSDLVKAVAGGAWQVTANTITFNPLSNMRVLSPLCPSGQEATSCAGFSGNTAVVLSSVMPAVGSSTNVKTTQCFCDFRNTLGVVLPANGGEVYRCVAYCQ